MIFSRTAPLSRGATSFALAFAILAAAGCSGGVEPAEESAPPEPAVEETPPAPAPGYDAAILDVAGRSEDDHYRDAGMKPLEVYGFFGVEPGMTIGDLSTSGMYNAHILSQIAGPEGKVYAIVGLGDSVSERRLESTQAAFEERNVDGVLSNVELIGLLEDLPENSLDALITVRNYHDFGERDARVANVARMARVLKPGGILGVVDAHTDKTDERDESVHRMHEDLAREELIEGGMEFVGASDVLYNADDTFDFDGRRPGDPIHRYYIHRWVLKFQKPTN